MYKVECPYCKKEEKYSYDSLSFEDGGRSELECPSCQKSFITYTSIHFSFDSQRAECLNDGEHVWRPNHAFPKCATKMFCAVCGEERNPTEDEKKQYNIPSYEDYLRSIK